MISSESRRYFAWSYVPPDASDWICVRGPSSSASPSHLHLQKKTSWLWQWRVIEEALWQFVSSSEPWICTSLDSVSSIFSDFTFRERINLSTNFSQNATSAINSRNLLKCGKALSAVAWTQHHWGFHKTVTTSVLLHIGLKFFGRIPEERRGEARKGIAVG